MCGLVIEYLMWKFAPKSTDTMISLIASGWPTASNDLGSSWPLGCTVNKKSSWKLEHQGGQDSERQVIDLTVYLDQLLSRGAFESRQTFTIFNTVILITERLLVHVSNQVIGIWYRQGLFGFRGTYLGKHIPIHTC